MSEWLDTWCGVVTEGAVGHSHVVRSAPVQIDTAHSVPTQDKGRV